MEDNHYQLLDGKAVSAQMKKEMAEEVAQIKAAEGELAARPREAPLGPRPGPVHSDPPGCCT